LSWLTTTPTTPYQLNQHTCLVQFPEVVHGEQDDSLPAPHLVRELVHSPWRKKLSGLGLDAGAMNVHTAAVVAHT